MQVAVDTREREALNCLYEEHNGLPISIRQLQLGDFELSDGSKRLLIERKTVADLCASIVDGRYREQRVRLSEAAKSGCSILYIIEGAPDSRLPYTTVISSMMSCLLKYKIPVIRTRSISDTCYVIAKLCEDLSAYCASDVSPDYVPQTKIHAPSNAAALSCAPRVSVPLAKRILDKYKTISNVVDAFKENGKHALCNVDKVGNKISEAIYKMLIL